MCKPRIDREKHLTSEKTTRLIPFFLQIDRRYGTSLRPYNYRSITAVIDIASMACPTQAIIRPRMRSMLRVVFPTPNYKIERTTHTLQIGKKLSGLDLRS